MKIPEKNTFKSVKYVPYFLGMMKQIKWAFQQIQVAIYVILCSTNPYIPQKEGHFSFMYLH